MWSVEQGRCFVALQKKIGETLKQQYEPVVQETLPPRLAELAKHLDRALMPPNPQ